MAPLYSGMTSYREGGFVSESNQRLCCIEGCSRVHRARGYCGMHYQRLKRRVTLVGFEHLKSATVSPMRILPPYGKL